MNQSSLMKSNCDVYNRTKEWIFVHSKAEDIGKSMINNTALPLGYPEVTGYYIPSLLRWGFRDLATEYAKWLLSIQKDDGSWYETKNRHPYVFDTAQVIRGQIFLRDVLPEIDGAILRGCEWILTNKQENGRLTTPDRSSWGDTKMCSELIHLYCLYPLKTAGEALGRDDFVIASERILRYYLTKWEENVQEFHLLSHFYAYVAEALLEMGEMDLASAAMNSVSAELSEDGVVPAYKGGRGVCAVGLFQLAMVWYRLGEWEKGERAFNYACNLQNSSGGWYGSYPVDGVNTANYFPMHEISWANKFFLDALYYRNCLHFTREQENFLHEIPPTDGRYQAVAAVAKKLIGSSARILDIGFGKGRFLKALGRDFPEYEYYGVDIAPPNKGWTLNSFKLTCGDITCLPYPNDFFDFVYAVESLEHAIEIENALAEMARVTKQGGTLMIIDKNKYATRHLKLDAWEQWFDAEGLLGKLEKLCDGAVVQKNIPYDNRTDDLFCVWKGIKK